MSLGMGKYEAVSSEKVSNHLSDDFTFPILSKLSLKSLKRFGCVHKSWALLFQNPHFMCVYRNNFIYANHSYYDDASLLLLQTLVRSDYNLHYALCLLSGERFENKVNLHLPPPVKEINGDINILGSGSINGILCLSSLSYQEKIVVLWNPTTEEFKVIPPSPVESIPYRKFVFLHGFGYDHVRVDYKVLQSVAFLDPTNIDIKSPGVPWKDVSWSNISYNTTWEIYSLRSNSWRTLDFDMPMALGRSDAYVRVYIDGMCHWTGQSDSRSAEAYLVSFDLCNEVLFTTLMPSDMNDNFDFELVRRQLVVLNGSISLISYYDKTTTFHITILGEIGVKESWTKLFIIGPLPCVMHPIGAWKNRDIFFINKDGELIRFDLSTQIIEELGVKGEMLWDKMIIYKESLLPIGGLNH